MKFFPKGFWKEKLDDRYKMVDGILLNSGSYLLGNIRKVSFCTGASGFGKILEILIRYSM